MRFRRWLAFVLVACMLLGVMAVGAGAATASLQVSQMVSEAGKAAEKLEKYIQMGEKDSRGVYSLFPFPSAFAVGNNEIDGASYILMVARGVLALSQGQAPSTAIPYSKITVE